jgi:moderate conductance mechanosensitive channel
MSAWVVPVAGSASPSPEIKIDAPVLEGDPTELVWWQSLLVGPVLRIVLILLVAFVARLVLIKAIERFVARLSAPPAQPSIVSRTTRTAREVIGVDVVAAERRATRAHSLGQLATNLTSVVVVAIATIMILGELGFNLAPLIAGAGVVGIAFGFGAQSVVADFMSGVFMLLEDQYGVGDVVDLGEASGVVEDVHLRVTRLRSVDGVVWYVRNGEVVRVGNMSQNWSRALLDIGVAYHSDVTRVRELMLEVSRAMAAEDAWEDVILEEPEVWGVEQLSADAIVVRLVVKTRPGQQWGVARELRQRIKQRFDAEGVEIPFPQRTVWMRSAEPEAQTDDAPPAPR